MSLTLQASPQGQRRRALRIFQRKATLTERETLTRRMYKVLEKREASKQQGAPEIAVLAEPVVAARRQNCKLGISL